MTNANDDLEAKMMRSLLNGTSILRRTLALALLPAAMLMFTATVSAQEVETERKVKIKVIADDSGEATELDLSDLMVGETRWISTDEGKEIGITREESGYRLNIDGEETMIQSPGDDMHNMVMVHATAGEEGHSLHSAMDNVWVTGDRKVIRLDGMESDGVFISGLGDLDEDQKAAIRDAMRAAGVEKEIVFAPAGGAHGYSFVTSGHSAHGDGAMNVEVMRKKLGDAVEGDGKHVIVIEKKVTSSSDSDDN